MQSHFQKDLADLKEKLLTMASLASNAVRNSIKALICRRGARRRHRSEWCIAYRLN